MPGLNPTPTAFQLYVFPGASETLTVSTDVMPSDATVTAKTNGTTFHVTQIYALALEWVPVDSGELSGGGTGHRGKPIRVQQWVEVASTDGSTPLTVLKGQTLLVEMSGVAPASTPSGGVTENLNVTVNGVPHGSFTVPITFEVGLVLLELFGNYNPPVPLRTGQIGEVAWFVEWKQGPSVDVDFRMDTFDSSIGVSMPSIAQTLTVNSANPNQYILIQFQGDSTYADPSHRFYMWMTISRPAGGGVIRVVPLPVQLVAA